LFLRQYFAWFYSHDLTRKPTKKLSLTQKILYIPYRFYMKQMLKEVGKYQDGDIQWSVAQSTKVFDYE
jgi:hypothetical protein